MLRLKIATTFSIFIFGIIISLAFTRDTTPDWGFYGHRMLNKYAVFTLPQPMLPMFKTNIKYLEEHAVDPDKRRYATKYEAVRHYIDIDHWGTYPFDNVPREFELAIIKFSTWKLVTFDNDTITIDKKYLTDSVELWVDENLLLKESHDRFSWFYGKNLKQYYYEDECIIDASAIDVFFNINMFNRDYSKLILEESFSDYGILPYHLVKNQRDLTFAFQNGDFEKALRLSADFGHYIGDAHVPLHTTENYNGQMTNQLGIHAFWESRIPELYAADEYDFFAGKAEYIEDKTEYFWDIVLESHSHLNDVLEIEKRLSKTFPTDQQYCYDERLGNTIRIQCPEYAKAYEEAMAGMVEDRWTKTIKAIGDAWYTAWLDAGQPELTSGSITVQPEEIKVDKDIKTRDHSN